MGARFQELSPTQSIPSIPQHSHRTPRDHFHDVSS